MADDSSASQHLLLKAKGVHETGSTPITDSAQSLAQFGISYGANDVTISIPWITDFSAAAASTDQKNVASALDSVSGSVSSGPFNTLLNTMSALGGAAQAQALDQVTGRVGSNFTPSANGNMQAALGVVQSRLGGGLGAEGPGPGQIGSADEVKVADASNLDWGPSRGDPENYTIWMRGFGEFENIGLNSTGPGISSTTGGGAVGFEWQPDSYDRVGLMFAAGQSWIDVSSVSQTGAMTTYAPGIYGSHDWGRYIADAALLFGHNTATSQRNIALLDETANGATNGYGVAAEGGLGYKFNLDKEDTTLRPRIGLSDAYSYENGYTETGAPGANLAIGASDQNLVQSTLGATLAGKFDIPDEDDENLGALHASGSLGWRQDWTTPQAAVSESFAGVASSSFTTYSTSPGREAAVIGLGVSFAPADMAALAVYGRYDGIVAPNETDHAVTAGVKYSW